MRRMNSEFQTLHISEEGQEFSNRDYFGYVEMDDFACYVLADSLDEEPSVNSARLVVDNIIRDFTEKPTIKKGTLKRYIKKAHRELLNEKKGMHLKAVVVVAVTDYRKIRYCNVGNCRLYWIRNARVLEKTKDQSLTQNLLEEEKIPLDEAAAHEERNNLYSFLGERGTPKIRISRKKKLENGDMFTLLTRGAWEQCQETDLLEIINTAKDPKDILNKTEDFILKEQEKKKIDNYTLAVTFVNKVYQSPKKPWTLKKILMIVLPILMVAGITATALYIRYKNIRTKTDSLYQYMESGEEYINCDNYPKAAEEYGQAKTLAEELKREKEYEESDQYVKLAEQIILADEALNAGEYEKAKELFLKAREMAVEAGNVGIAYIDSQLARTEGYIEVFDLIAQGEYKEGYGNLKGAIELYKKAKEKAAGLYFNDGKEEALGLQMSAEEELEKQEAEAEKRLQEKIDEQAADLALENEQKSKNQQSAIELENQGNELLSQGNYESALTFFQAAQSLYRELELEEMAERINEKINAAKAGIAAKNAMAEQNAAAEQPLMDQ